MITLCEIFTFMLRIQRKHSDESFFAKTLSLTVNSYNELLMKWSMEKNHYFFLYEACRCASSLCTGGLGPVFLTGGSAYRS